MASQIASLRNAAGVERGFRLRRKTFPRRVRVVRHRFYFECLATYLILRYVSYYAKYQVVINLVVY